MAAVGSYSVKCVLTRPSVMAVHTVEDHCSNQVFSTTLKVSKLN